jgi:hypothetical protein
MLTRKFWSKMWGNYLFLKAHIDFATICFLYSHVYNKILKILSMEKTLQWAVNSWLNSIQEYYQLCWLITFKSKMFRSCQMAVWLISSLWEILCTSIAKKQKKDSLEIQLWLIFSFNSLSHNKENFILRINLQKILNN